MQQSSLYLMSDKIERPHNLIEEELWCRLFHDPIPESSQGGWTDAFLFLGAWNSWAAAHPVHFRSSTSLSDCLRIGAQNIHMIKYSWFIAFGVNQTMHDQLSFAWFSFVQGLLQKTMNDAIKIRNWKSSDQTVIMNVTRLVIPYYRYFSIRSNC